MRFINYQVSTTWMLYDAFTDEWTCSLCGPERVSFVRVRVLFVCVYLFIPDCETIVIVFNLYILEAVKQGQVMANMCASLIKNE